MSIECIAHIHEGFGKREDRVIRRNLIVIRALGGHRDPGSVADKIKIQRGLLRVMITLKPQPSSSFLRWDGKWNDPCSLIAPELVSFLGACEVRPAHNSTKARRGY